MVPVIIMSWLMATVSIVMADFIPTLAAVVSVAAREKDLERIGFTRRRRQGMGTYREGNEIDHNAAVLSDALAAIPGIHIAHSNTGMGTKSMITGASGLNGCLTIVVDGVVWQDSDGSSIEDFVRPNELEAVELYSSTTAPLEFAIASTQSSCQVLVLWTRSKIRSRGTSAKPPL